MILPAKSIRDMPAVWSACLLCGLLCCLLLRVLCGLVRWSYDVVFALLFQVSKWVSGCVVLEAVRVVHVIICKCVVQRGVAYLVPGTTGIKRYAELFFSTYSTYSSSGHRKKRKVSGATNGMHIRSCHRTSTFLRSCACRGAAEQQS